MNEYQLIRCCQNNKIINFFDILIDDNYALVGWSDGSSSIISLMDRPSAGYQSTNFGMSCSCVHPGSPKGEGPEGRLERCGLPTD
jgi:hypothetical protein